MAITLKIAWRNLWRHKGKSLIVGTILFFGALIMTFGNAVVAGMERGLEQNIISRFTGHIVLVSTNTGFDNILYTMMGENLSEMHSWSNTKAVIDKHPAIERYMPATRGVAFLLNEEGQSDGVIMFGVDFEEYRKMFGTNTVFREGRELKKGERGLLVNVNNRKAWWDFQNLWAVPEGAPLISSNLPPEFATNMRLAGARVKRDIVLLGLNPDSASADIRVPIRGVFEFSNLNELWGFVNIIDIQSFRECFNYVIGDEKTAVEEKAKSLLEASGDNLDALIGSGELVVANDTGAGYDANTVRRETSRADLVPVRADAGSYNVVFIKLKPGQDPDSIKESLNLALKAGGSDARAMTWRGAIGQIADMAGLIKAALAGFVFFIFVVAVIVIMNTLSMSAIERTSEIGMMRAVGAQKGFISRMFLSEIVILSGGFGGMGILVGTVLTAIVAGMGITTDNGIAQLLFGGDRFIPMLDAGDIIACIVQLTLVTFAAWLYPARIARRITPLEAIARD